MSPSLLSGSNAAVLSFYMCSTTLYARRGIEMDAGKHLVEDEVLDVEWWVFSPPSPARPCRAGHLGFRPGDCFLNLTELYCRGGISDPGLGRITRDDNGVYAVIVCDEREVPAYTRTATARCPISGDEEIRYRVPYDGGGSLAAFKPRPIRLYRSFAWGGVRYEGLYRSTGFETDHPFTDAYIDLVRMRDQTPLSAVETKPTARHMKQWDLYVSAVEREEADAERPAGHTTASQSKL